MPSRPASESRSRSRSPARPGATTAVSVIKRAARAIGLEATEIAAAGDGRSDDAAASTVLRLAVGAAVDPHGVSDTDVAAVRGHGFGDAEIVEILGHVALNLFTNHFNIVSGAEIDVPEAGSPEASTGTR